MAEKFSKNDRDVVLKRLKLVLARLMKLTDSKNPENIPAWSWDTDIFDDVGVDSVDTIDLMYAIEEEFGVTANMKDGQLRRKLSEIVDYIIEISATKDI